MTEIVFVGGAGRSGTTFLAHQLARFSGIHAAGESQWIVELIERQIPRRECVSFTRNHWKVIQAPVTISDQDWSDLDAIAREHPLTDFIRALMTLLAGGSGVIVDHTPTNLSRRRALLSVFPDARFLHLVRDGRAVFASLKKVAWGPNTPPAAAQYWESFVANGALAELVMGDSVTRVHYEDIVTDPKLVLQLAADLLRTDVASIIPKETQGQVPLAGYTQKQHALVNLPPDVSRIRSWESHLSQHELEAFEYLASGTLTSLGYRLSSERLVEPSHRRRLRWATEEYLRFAIFNPVRNAVRTQGAHLWSS